MPLSSPIQVGDLPHTITSAAALATVLYLPVVRPGRIKDFHVTVGAALTGANQTFQLAYAPPGSSTYVDVTNGIVTQLTAGSAAGVTVRQQLAVTQTANVQDGGSIRVTPAGGGAGAVPLTIAVVIGG